MASHAINSKQATVTPIEFRQALIASSDEELVNHFFNEEDIPYVFNDNGQSWEAFRTDVADSIGANRQDLRIIGSGRFGVSLNPMNNLRAFEDTSDVDVVVVNPELFDKLWYLLLDAQYPRPPSLLTEALRKRQSDVYTGWIDLEQVRFDLRLSNDAAKAAVEFKSIWFNALQKSSKHVVRRHSQVKARLYRTWDHARKYHHFGMLALRSKLTAR